MENPPKEERLITLYSQPITVQYADSAHWSGGMMGQANARDWVITLADNLTPDVESNTLLHELIHMIADTQELGLSEVAVNVLTNGLLDLFRRNESLREELFNRKVNENHDIPG